MATKVYRHTQDVYFFCLKLLSNMIAPVSVNDSLQLSINAFDYNCHVDLIKLLKQEGELLRLRKARQKMSELFPLTEGLFMTVAVQRSKEAAFFL